MRRACLAGVCVVASWATAANADPVASEPTLYDQICQNGIVVKNKLMVYLLGSSIPTVLLAGPMEHHTPTGNVSFIRELLANPNACDGEKEICGKEADTAMSKLRNDFIRFVKQGNRDGTFTIVGPAPPSRFFSGSDNNPAMTCVAPKAPPKPQNPTSAQAPTSDKPVDPITKLRIRGDTADLIYDRNSDEFKSASAAKVNYNDDRSSGHKFTTKVNGTVGYAYSIVDSVQLRKQVIPFVSINQTITDQDGQRKLDDSNYFAGGSVLNLFYAPDSVLAHSFSSTPQFLYNTKDRSQIASFRLDYQPYLNSNLGKSAPFDLNWATLSKDAKTVLTLIFGLRSDIGYYVRKGDITDPSLHHSFGLVGTQVGFALKLIDYRLTLKASEWLLYGYAGDHRTLDLFDGSITYSLDPDDYFGLEFDYKRGRDLNTMDPIQQWTIGLTAKY